MYFPSWVNDQTMFGSIWKNGCCVKNISDPPQKATSIIVSFIYFFRLIIPFISLNCWFSPYRFDVSVMEGGSLMVMNNAIYEWSIAAIFDALILTRNSPSINTNTCLHPTRQDKCMCIVQKPVNTVTIFRYMEWWTWTWSVHEIVSIFAFSCYTSNVPPFEGFECICRLLNRIWFMNYKIVLFAHRIQLNCLLISRAHIAWRPDGVMMKC